MNVDFYILIHDRVDFLRMQLEYLHTSNCKNSTELPTIILSCNSNKVHVQDECRKIAEKYNHKFILNNSKNLFGHMKYIALSSNQDFICCLHDDDLVRADLFNQVATSINNNPNSLSHAPFPHFFRSKLKAEYEIRDIYVRFNVLIMYFLYLINRSGPAFPSIVYDRKELLKLFDSFDEKFGKYSDVLIVEYFVKRGMTIFKSSSFWYRLHDGNWSRDVDKENRRSLKIYLSKMLLLNFCKPGSYTGFLPSLYFTYYLWATKCTR
jgi:hypothetical protein